MGCKQSAPVYEYNPKDLVIDAHIDYASEEEHAIECSAVSTSTTENDNRSSPIPNICSDATPHEIRRIRDELFSKDSVLAMAASTNQSSLLKGDESSSNGGSFNSESANKGIRFQQDVQEDAKERGPFEARPVSSQPKPSAVIGRRKSSIGSTKSSKSGNGYHYPAALYAELKGVHHFVPSSSNKSSGAACKLGIRDVSSQSGFKSETSDDEDNVVEEAQPMSRFSTERTDMTDGNTTAYTEGLDDDESHDSHSLDSNVSSFSYEEKGSFPQFEALVDTMAMSLDPLLIDPMSPTNNGDRSETGVYRSLSFGALVDQLTQDFDIADLSLGDDDEDSKDRKKDDELKPSVTDDKENCSFICNPSATTRRDRRVILPPALSKRSKKDRRSAPPMLEQKASSEMLADMKTLALMTNSATTSRRRFNQPSALETPNEHTSNEEEGDENDDDVDYEELDKENQIPADHMTATSHSKFERSSTEAVTKGNKTVCTQLQLTNWM